MCTGDLAQSTVSRIEGQVLKSDIGMTNSANAVGNSEANCGTFRCSYRSSRSSVEISTYELAYQTWYAVESGVWPRVVRIENYHRSRVTEHNSTTEDYIRRYAHFVDIGVTTWASTEWMRSRTGVFMNSICCSGELAC